MKTKRFILSFLFLALTFVLFGVLFGCGVIGGKQELEQSHIYYPTNFINRNYDYTGEPITFDETQFRLSVNGKLYPFDHVSVEYRNNILPGIADVIFTADEENSYVKGTLTLHFYINPASATVETEEELLAALAAPVNSSFIVAGKIETDEPILLAESSDLFILEGASLVAKGGLRNRGSIRIGKGKSAAELIVVNFVNEGSLEVEALSCLYASGSFTDEGKISVKGTIYTDGVTPGNATVVGKGKIVVRQPVTDSDVTLSPHDYQAKEHIFPSDRAVYEPSVSLNSNDYNVRFENNDHAGDALAIIEMGYRDRSRYGSVQVEFHIEKGRISIQDYPSLVAAMERENFKYYDVASLVVPAGETLVVDEDEELNCNAVEFLGNFEVHGTARAFGVFAEGCSVVVSGSLAKRAVLNLGGERADGSFFVDETGELFLNPTNTPMRGTVTVAGSLQFGYSIREFRFEEGSGLTITESGECVIGGDLRLENAVFTNRGVVNCRYDAVFASGARLVNSGSWDNDVRFGKIWYIEEDGVSGLGSDVVNVTKCRLFSDVVLAPDEPSLSYIAETRIPTFYVEGDPEPILPASNVKYSYYYEGAANPTSTPKKVGKIRVKVTTTDEHYRYWGEAESEYDIVPGTCEAGTTTEMKRLFEDEGWGYVRLNRDVTLITDLVVPESVTLDTALHRLDVTSERTLTVNGVLFIPAREGENDRDRDNYGVFLESGGKISFGSSAKLINEGYLLETDALISVASGGRVINRGTMYLVSPDAEGNLPYPLEEEGALYVRKKLSLLRREKEFTETPYLLSDIPTPWVKHYDGEKQIDPERVVLEFGSRDAVGYVSGTARIKDVFDREYTGSDSGCGFIITYGEAQITKQEDFAAALNNPNWGGYRLKNNLRLDGFGSKGGVTYTLPKGTYLDIGTYDITFVNEAKIDLLYAELWATANTLERLKRYKYGAAKVTLGMDVETLLVMSEDEASTVRMSGYKNPNKSLTTTFDLNGHSLLQGFRAYTSNRLPPYNLTFIDSGEQKGWIRANTSEKSNGMNGYAVYVEDEYGVTISFDGVQTEGVYLKLNGKSSVTIKNSLFDATKGNADAAFCFSGPQYVTLADDPIGNYEKSEFRGKCAVKLIGEKHIFFNCTFYANGAYETQTYETHTYSTSGTALVVNANAKSRTAAIVSGGKIESLYGNGIEVVNPASEGDMFAGNVEYVIPEGKQKTVTV